MIVPSSCRELPGLLGNIKMLQYSIEKTNVIASDTSIPVSFERRRVNLDSEMELKNNLA